MFCHPETLQISPARFKQVLSDSAVQIISIPPKAPTSKLHAMPSMKFVKLAASYSSPDRRSKRKATILTYGNSA
jgi:hypothetical protein